MKGYEWQDLIATMNDIAFADEDDRITSSDLAYCETPASVIMDLEDERDKLKGTLRFIADIGRVEKCLRPSNG